MAASGGRSKLDPYGFERSDNFDYDAYEAFMSEYLSVLARRRSKWDTYVKNKNGDALHKSRKLKRYIRKGVPAQHRPLVWMAVSGAETRRRQNPNLYENLLHMPHEKELIEVIKTDLHRTFPDNIYFQNAPGDPNAKRGSLYNVLIALAHKNRRVGYCQGMNFVTGLLLLTVKDEDKVFWLMDTLMTDILPDYYSQDMVSVQVDEEVLGELVKRRDPDLARLLESAGCSWPLVSTKWFICIFADVVPVETVLRIWDCLFYEGSKILFRVGLALVRQHRAQLLACRSFPEMVNLFKQMTSDAGVTQCHDFMESVFKHSGKLTRHQIEDLRKQQRAIIQAGREA